MLQCVKATIARHNMLEGVKDVTVALSGGADSVALLSVMLKIRDEFGFTLSAAHLNHCLRGEEADRDERFVRELCERLNVPLFCEKADVKAFAKDNSMSIELAARQVRYAFLERVSKGVIATAHNANDNFETVLHNMARGTGIVGLCGIRPRRDRFIRPLIEVGREAIERYCAEEGLSFCTDSTNSDESYTRNRIRHSIVPQMVSVNSGAVKNVTQMSETLREDASFLEIEAEKHFKNAKENGGLSVEALCGMHPSMTKRCILKLFEEGRGRVLERQHVNAVYDALKSEKCRLSVIGDMTAEIKNGVLRFVPSKPQKITETVPNELPFLYEGIKVSLILGKDFQNLLKINSLLLNNAADYDKLCGVLKLRGRLAGDRITLVKRNCTKSFKKLLNESGLDEQTRDGLLVAADDMGVVWLEGFGVDHRVAVSENTQNVLIFEAVED